MISLLSSLVIGGICGWLAGKIMKTNFSLVMNVILGIIGGVVGGLLLGLIGFSSTGLIGGIISGVLGACVIIYVVRAIKK